MVAGSVGKPYTKIEVNLASSNSLATVPDTVTLPQGEMTASFTVTSGTEIGEVDVKASASRLTSGASII